MTKEKENRGGKREGAGAKGKYVCKTVKFNDRIPELFMDELKEFIEKGKEKYLKKYTFEDIWNAEKPIETSIKAKK